MPTITLIARRVEKGEAGPIRRRSSRTSNASLSFYPSCMRISLFLFLILFTTALPVLSPPYSQKAPVATDEKKEPIERKDGARYATSRQTEEKEDGNASIKEN